MVGCGVAASGLLLFVLFQIDIGPERVEETQVEPDEGFTDLIPRRPPDSDSPVGALDSRRVTMLPDLDEGGWIETFDRTTGKLAQRYRFERLDPNPPTQPWCTGRTACWNRAR